MAMHWLPVQGFDEDLADPVFRVNAGGFGVRSNPGEVEEDLSDPPLTPNKATTTPKKRRAAAQEPTPRKKTPVAAKAVNGSSEPAMAKNREEEEPTIKPDSDVTTNTPQKSHAPTTPESRMAKNEEITPTGIVKPDPELSPTTPTTTPKNKRQKKTNPKASVATEGISTPPPKNGKAKSSNVPMPTSWAEAGEADRMMVAMRDKGDDWAKIRKQWKEMTGMDTAASTLPTRYSRIKASMTVLQDGDVARLIHAKDQVELRLQTEKYAMIADTLEQLGGKRYSNAFIRKEVKKLEKTGAAAATAAERGADEGIAAAAGIKDEGNEGDFDS